MKKRIQCSKCPWKVSTDPDTIPNGYTREQHARLSRTIRSGPSSMQAGPKMACHESEVGEEEVCIGWLDNQLGPGNNFGLRMEALDGRFGEWETVGSQHPDLQSTLSRKT